MDANLREITENMTAWQKEMKANREVTDACLEMAEACLESKEPTSGDTETMAVHKEVPKSPQLQLSEH
jgi:hypothetical protein